VTRALVFGGTGAVGSAVLHELARRGVPAVFTFCRSADKAKMLELELGHTAVHIDLADATATAAILARDDLDLVVLPDIDRCHG